MLQCMHAAQTMALKSLEQQGHNKTSEKKHVCLQVKACADGAGGAHYARSADAVLLRLQPCSGGAAGGSREVLHVYFFDFS